MSTDYSQEIGAGQTPAKGGGMPNSGEVLGKAIQWIDRNKQKLAVTTGLVVAAAALAACGDTEATTNRPNDSEQPKSSPTQASPETVNYSPGSTFREKDAQIERLSDGVKVVFAESDVVAGGKYAVFFSRIHGELGATLDGKTLYAVGMGDVQNIQSGSSPDAQLDAVDQVHFFAVGTSTLEYVGSIVNGNMTRPSLTKVICEPDGNGEASILASLEQSSTVIVGESVQGTVVKGYPLGRARFDAQGNLTEWTIYTFGADEKQEMQYDSKRYVSATNSLLEVELAAAHDASLMSAGTPADMEVIWKPLATLTPTAPARPTEAPKPTATKEGVTATQLVKLLGLPQSSNYIMKGESLYFKSGQNELLVASPRQGTENEWKIEEKALVELDQKFGQLIADIKLLSPSIQITGIDGVIFVELGGVSILEREASETGKGVYSLPVFDEWSKLNQIEVETTGHAAARLATGEYTYWQGTEWVVFDGKFGAEVLPEVALILDASIPTSIFDLDKQGKVVEISTANVQKKYRYNVDKTRIYAFIKGVAVTYATIPFNSEDGKMPIDEYVQAGKEVSWITETDRSNGTSFPIVLTSEQGEATIEVGTSRGVSKNIPVLSRFTKADESREEKLYDFSNPQLLKVAKKSIEKQNEQRSNIDPVLLDQIGGDKQMESILIQYAIESFRLNGITKIDGEKITADLIKKRLAEGLPVITPEGWDMSKGAEGLDFIARSESEFGYKDDYLVVLPDGRLLYAITHFSKDGQLHGQEKAKAVRMGQQIKYEVFGLDEEDPLFFLFDELISNSEADIENAENLSQVPGAVNIPIYSVVRGE